jgi:hypothetical protein
MAVVEPYTVGLSPPPAIVTGDLSVDLINQAQRVIDMDDRIAELEPNASPLVVLLKKLKRVQAISPKVEWLEQLLMPRYDTVTGAATNVATTFGVNHPSFFRVGDVIRDTFTGEAMEVTGVTGTNLNVNRGIGAVPAAAIGATDELFIVSNVNVEGASLRTIKTSKLNNMANFCEIVRTPFGLTGTEAASKLYGGPDRDRLQAAGAIEHMRDWEQICFFGAKKEDTNTSGAPKRFAGGLIEYIITNVVAAGGALTEAVFVGFLRAGFRYGSDRKILFASPLVVQAIEGFARNNIRVSPSDDHADTYGIAMKTYVSGQGTVDIVMERAWNDSTTYKGYAFLVDMDGMEWHTLRDTKLLEGRQANDADKLEDEYLTEACPVVKNEPKHALLTGVTG